jgi:hypothetical protein
MYSPALTLLILGSIVSVVGLIFVLRERRETEFTPIYSDPLNQAAS